MRATRRRTRTIEDMPEGARVTATAYSIPSHWCPACRKHVEPRLGAALPKCAIGNRIDARLRALAQAVLMTIHRTLKLRGIDPQTAIAHALTAYAATGTLPPMPSGAEGG